MAESTPGFSDERRSDNDNRKSRISESAKKLSTPEPRKETLKERWDAVQFSKTTIFWTCLGVIAATMLVGFSFGGWVSGATAEKTATTMAGNAVVDRLASICVAQFHQDPAKTEKLVELKAASSFQQKTYVTDQGWSTMMDDEKTDTKVSAACAKLLTQIDE